MRNFLNAALMFVIMACASSAMAGQFWSQNRTTNGLIVSANILMFVDWTHTRYIADNPDKFHERGVAAEFIGEHPTTGQVNAYFVASLLAMNGIGYLLPESAETFGVRWNPKKSFYLGASLYEGYFVQQNYVLGIRGEF